VCFCLGVNDCVQDEIGETFVCLGIEKGLEGKRRENNQKQRMDEIL
jgi:hypothetical protein